MSDINLEFRKEPVSFGAWCDSQNNLYSVNFKMYFKRQQRMFTFELPSGEMFLNMYFYLFDLKY